MTRCMNPELDQTSTTLKVVFYIDPTLRFTAKYLGQSTGKSSSDVDNNKTFNRFRLMDFATTGSKKNDLWLINGSKNFSIFPANTIPTIKIDVPVWLKVGDKSFGERHIKERHFRWVAKSGLDIPELVHVKLGHHGNIFCSETDSKIKVNLALHPSALLVLEYIDFPEPHFSVTTLYYHDGKLDGRHIGRYRGRQHHDKIENSKNMNGHARF